VAKIFKLSIILLVITMATGIILGGIYTITLEPIRMAKQNEKMEALAATLPGATVFKPVSIKGDPGIIKEINEGSADGQLIGYNFTVTPKGYGGPVELIAGISKDGQLMDIKILNHKETPGLGAKAKDQPFAGQFKDKKVDELAVTKTPVSKENEIQAISGATITSRAVVSGVNAALTYWKQNLREGGAN
jgi:electron transport complex protein RnfG